MKEQKKYFSLSHKHLLELNSKLKARELAVYLYLASENGSLEAQINVDTAKIAKDLNYHRSTVQKVVKDLKNLGLIKVESRNHNQIENEIRDRLIIENFPLALKEVDCPAGRIDILSKSQIIEVKRVNDWKSALGQILVYSAYYPEHQKRIHLFGIEGDREKLLDIELSCSSFDVSVTFEAIGGAE